MAVKSKRPLVTLMSLAILALPMLSAPTYAEEFLCDATQASSDTLPVLDAACPIGKGMWGKQKPKGQASYFWIQCGVYGKPLALPERTDAMGVAEIIRRARTGPVDVGQRRRAGHPGRHQGLPAPH